MGRSTDAVTLEDARASIEPRVTSQQLLTRMMQVADDVRGASPPEAASLAVQLRDLATRVREYRHVDEVKIRDRLLETIASSSRPIYSNPREAHGTPEFEPFLEPPKLVETQVERIRSLIYELIREFEGFDRDSTPPAAEWETRQTR